MRNFLSFAGAAALLALALPAQADFTGQTILGPLTLGSVIDGDNTGASDDNDGWFSGDHIFDLWNGGDDVYALNWTGGDMSIALTYDAQLSEPDLFLYTPSNLDESALDSIAGTGFDSVTLAGAAAGTYYVLIDTTAGSEGAYHLEVTPEPTSLALLALGGLVLARRRS